MAIKSSAIFLTLAMIGSLFLAALLEVCLDKYCRKICKKCGGRAPFKGYRRISPNSELSYKIYKCNNCSEIIEELCV